MRRQIAGHRRIMALAVEVERAHRGLRLRTLVDAVDEMVPAGERRIVESRHLCRGIGGEQERDDRQWMFHFLNLRNEFTADEKASLERSLKKF